MIINFFLVCLLIAKVVSNKLFTLTAVNCTFTCLKQMCMNIKADEGDFEMQVCPLLEISSNLNMKVRYGYCQYTFDGFECNQNLCQFPLNNDCVTGSYFDVTLKQNLPKSLMIGCQACPPNIKSKACRFYRISDNSFTEVIQRFLPSSDDFDCHDLDETQKIDFYDCPGFKSISGVQCDFCYKSETLDKSKVGICATPFFGHPKKFMSYLKKLVEKPVQPIQTIVELNHERVLYYFGMLLVLFLFQLA